MRKISEVVVALEEMKAKHGDIDLINEQGETIDDLEYNADGGEPAVVFSTSTNDFD